ncbi:MAG: heme-binding protein, partial [Planctomycetota bacterium]
LVFEGKEGPGKGKHVVFMSGDEEYRSEEALPMLAKILSQKYGFTCTVLFAIDPDGTINPNNSKSLPGAEALDSADVVVTSLRFRGYPDDIMKHFAAAYDKGTAFVGLRTSTHAFNGIPGADYKKFNGFGKKVYGEGWVSHWGGHKSQATKGIVEAASKDDTILRGVEDMFCTTDVYEAYPPADAKILVRGQVLKGMTPDSPPAENKKKRSTDKAEQGINDPMMAVAWTRLYKNEAGKENKIFCTTTGAANDLENEGLRRMTINAVFWGAGLDVPAKADVAFIDEYKPLMYGFNGFRFGLKPSDLGLGKVMPILPLASEKMKKPEPKKPDAKKTEQKKTNDVKPTAEQTPKAPAEKGIAGADLLKIPPRPARPALSPSAVPLTFIKNERIAFLGSALAERMNLFGYFETLLHSRFPQQELVVRNFARPADEVGIHQRSDSYTKLTDPLQAFGADTFLCFFGFNESFKGADGVAKFKSDYDAFIAEHIKLYPRDDTNAAPRFIIVSPIAFEITGDKFLPSGKKENENLKLYAAAAKEVAEKHKFAFIDIFTPTEALFGPNPGMKYTVNGAHLNEQGDKEVAEMLDRALFGTTTTAQIGSPKFEKLRAAINDKSWIHHQDYRMLNGWYVYGGRRTYDTETFPREYVKIRNMAAKRDAFVWALSQDKDPGAAPDDSNTGELIVPPTRFGVTKKSEAEELRYLTPEDEIKTFTLPPGYEVQLVASEREFPELAKPDQISFDNKGRLWVSCMPTYPQWRPGDPKPKDRLLIFEDFDEKGKARKMTVFYDQLVCPTGFEFWNGGVLVVDEPRILFLKDTKGTGKADLVVQYLDGWATDDTHHTINAWEWSNGGLLHMMEGVSLSTTVETPWGPFRNQGSSGIYVLDPRSQKLRHFNTPGYGNPWCYVFNWWGQGICGDGTGAQHHWDSCLSGEQFSGRRGVNP